MQKLKQRISTLIESKKTPIVTDWNPWISTFTNLDISVHEIHGHLSGSYKGIHFVIKPEPKNKISWIVRHPVTNAENHGYASAKKDIYKTIKILIAASEKLLTGLEAENIKITRQIMAYLKQKFGGTIHIGLLDAFSEFNLEIEDEFGQHLEGFVWNKDEDDGMYHVAIYCFPDGETVLCTSVGDSGDSNEYRGPAKDALKNIKTYWSIQ